MTGRRKHTRNRAVFTRICAVFALALWPELGIAQDAEATRDRGILQAFLEDNLSATGREVRIEGFVGALSGRATIDELTIADEDGVWLTLRDAVLDWNRGALLRGRLEVAELSAAELILPRKPVAQPAPPSATAGSRFSLPDLPVSIQIDTLTLDRVVLGAPLFGQAAVVSLAGAATLSGGAGEAELTSERIDGPRGQLALRGSYSNTTRNLALALELIEAENGIAANLLNLPGLPSVDLQIAGDAPIDDFRADISLDTDGMERLSGIVTLTTERDDTDATTRRVAADIGGDIAPVFAPQYRPFFGPDITLQLRAVTTPDGRQEINTLRLAARAIEITGTGAIAADGWPERLALTGRIVDPDGSAVDMPIGPEGTRIDTATLALDFDRATGDAWRLEADAAGIVQNGNTLETMTLRAGGQLREARGGAPGGVDGTLRLDARGLGLRDAALSRAVGDALRARLAFAWNENTPLRLRDINLAGPDYGLSGAVTLALPDTGIDILADLDTRLEAQDLSRFGAVAGLPLSGTASLAITGNLAPVSGAVDLRLAGQTRDLQLGQPRVDPLLAGPGRLVLQLRRNTDGTFLDQLEIATDHARITGTAQLDATRGQFDVDARITEVARVEPGLSGPARLTARGRGENDDWDLTADADLPGEGRATWAGRLTDATGDARIEGELTAALGSLRPYSQLTGRPLSGGVTARADVAATLANLSGTLAIEATTRDISVGVPLADAQLRGTGQIMAQLQRAPDGRLNVETATLSTPALTLDASGSMTDDSQAVTFSARMRDGSVIAPELAGPVAADGSARRSTGDWRLGITGTGPGGATLAASGDVASDLSRAALGLVGRAPLGLANERLRPRSLSGMAAYDLRLNGPIALSSLSGRITANDARLTLPDLRLALGNIDAQATLGGGQARLDVTGAVSSGGQLRLTGPIALSAPYQADLTIAANTVGLSQARLFKTTVDGNVTVSGPLTGGARIAGDLTLGPAELRVPSTSGVRYANLPGLKHLNEPAEVRRVRDWAGLVEDGEGGLGAAAASGPAYPVDLVIRAPSRIFVRGRGLDAELGGELRLRGSTAALVPIGRFDLVRGRLDILGKRLTLTEGYLQLQGSFDPYLRFAAAQQSEDVAITLAIEGLASAPDLQLTSAPELPQDEILSLLLFGREVTRISPLQAVRLASALRTLSGRGGTGLTGQLRQSLALDDLDVTTDEEGNVEARAGKYISENIYSDVTVNGEGETEINLNLTVSPSVTVRGRLGSDGDTGLGVYFERDY